MKYVKIERRMRMTGIDQQTKKVTWMTTPDFLVLFCRGGKSLNTGMNIFEADKIRQACEAAKTEETSYVALEDSSYNMLMEDVKVMNFKELGLNGLAIVTDIKALQAAQTIENKPEDFNTKFVPIYPTVEEVKAAGLKPEYIPSEVIDKKEL